MKELDYGPRWLAWSSSKITNFCCTEGYHSKNWGRILPTVHWDHQMWCSVATQYKDLQCCATSVILSTYQKFVMIVGAQTHFSDRHFPGHFQWPFVQPKNSSLENWSTIFKWGHRNNNVEEKNGGYKWNSQTWGDKQRRKNRGGWRKHTHILCKNWPRTFTH